MKFKQLLTITMIVTLIATSFPTTYTKAAPATDDYTTVLASVQFRCQELSEALNNVSSSQSDLLYSMQLLAEYTLNYTFLYQARKELGITDAELEELAIALSDKLQNFDERYGTSSNSSFTSVKLGYKYADNEQFNELCLSIYAKVIPLYLQDLMKSKTEEVASITDDAKIAEWCNENKYFLVRVFRVTEVYATALDELTQLLDTDAAVDITEKSKKYDAQKQIKKLLKDYSTYLEFAQEASKSVPDMQTLTVNLEKPVIENLTNAAVVNERVSIPNNPELTLLYKMFVAAGAVYQPFTSYVGDQAFQNAVETIASNEGLTEESLKLFNTVKDVRKPLYYRVLDDEGNPAGKADLITIEEFLSMIENGSSGALCTIAGKFGYDKNSQTWIYDLTKTGVIDKGSSVYSGTNNTTANNSINGSAVSNQGQSTVAPSASPSASPSVSPSATPTAKEDSEKVTIAQIAKSIRDWATIPSVAKAAQLSPDELEGDSQDPNQVQAITPGPTTGNTNSSTTTTVVTDTDNSLVTGIAEAVYATDTVTDETKMSDAVLMFGVEKSRDIDNLTSVVLTNLIQSNSIAIGGIERKESRYLYMNAFGDVVTDDNLVILPACANPLIFDYTITTTVKTTSTRRSSSTSKSTNQNSSVSITGTNVSGNRGGNRDPNAGRSVNDSDTTIPNASASTSTEPTTETTVEEVVINLNEYLKPDDANGYYPFSVAFMNSYPTVMNNVSYFQVSNQNDVGKYMIFGDTTDTEQEVTAEFRATKITESTNIDSDAPLQVPHVIRTFTLDGTSKVKSLDVIRLIFGSYENWNSGSELYYYSPLVSTTKIGVNGNVLFPYSSETDKKLEMAGVIGKAAYYYYTVEQSTGTAGGAKRFNDNYIIHNIVANILDGTSNPTGFSQSQALQYEQFVEQSTNRFEKLINTLSSDLFKHMGYLDKIIGMQDSYRDPILGKLFAFVKEYWYAFAFIILVVTLLFFAKSRYDLFQMIWIGAAIAAGAYVFVMILPNWSQTIFNWLVNDISERFVYETLADKAEYYSDVTSRQAKTDEDIARLNNASLTLYKVSNRDMESFLGAMGVEESDVVGGKTRVINESSGVYAEGNMIKVQTNKLFHTLKIEGSNKVSDGLEYYAYDTKKTVSNNVDYYNAFYLIADSFVEKLNTLSKCYEMTPKSSTYLNGRVKENFLVYSYVNSYPFLTPGAYSTELPEDHSNMSDEEIQGFVAESALLEERLTNAFGINADFLGVADFLYEPTDSMKQTLWCKTMQNNGYYNEAWEVNEQAMENLVTYINLHTKKFIFAMEDKIGVLSDDVMIKLITLRATIAMNQKVSTYNSMIYPLFVNSDEFTLNDVLGSAFSNDYNTFLNTEMNVVDYVTRKYNALNLLVFDVMVVLLFCVAYSVQIGVPVLYLALMVILLLKLLMGDSVRAPFHGFVKVCVVEIGATLVVMLVLILLKATNGMVASVYFALAALMLYVALLVSMLGAIVGNLYDLGGKDTAKDTILSIGEGLGSVFGKMRNLFSRNTLANQDPLAVHTSKKEYEHSPRFKGSLYGKDGEVNHSLNKYRND